MSIKDNKKIESSNDFYTLLPTVFSKMNIQDKHKLFSKWVDNYRFENDAQLDILFQLDDIYKQIYKESRIENGFQEARLIGYEKILTIVYGG